MKNLTHTTDSLRFCDNLGKGVKLVATAHSEKSVNVQSEVPPRSESNWKVPEVMATIGPTLEKLEDLERAIEAGARWFRLPCGYRQRPHLENSRAVRSASRSSGLPVQLLLDLPSSRPRTGTMEELRLAIGDTVLFWDPETEKSAHSNNGTLHVPLPGLSALISKLRIKHRMWFCDGRLSFVIDELRDGSVLTRMEKGTIPLKSSNSIFLPDSPSPFTVMTTQDRSLLESFRQNDVTPDWIALSLVGSADDVLCARKEAQQRLGSTPRVMAKFETEQALEVMDEIISAADGVMVARGDLGLAVGYIRLPEVQEKLVAAARQAGKPVIVATQALEMFAENGLPQRAELSDLSLIARQRADAVMLGKETVFSPRPIECI
ncbi:MAG TPA: pyruvate kinase, partial [Verrucomicrobiae bacterium]|nr:pyruvate kinase [Verrucomicrobiae bacterium]